MASSGSIEVGLVRCICDSATKTASAAKHLAKHGVVRLDEVEPLPKAFWIRSPSGVIQLISGSE
jgi:hypothetical protein